MCSVYGVVKVSQKYFAIKLMALFLLSVVAGKLFVKFSEFSEESYFYFFQELSCLPPCNGTNAQGDTLGSERGALDQGF